MLSIPGITQVQYEYKGLFNGPEVRTFKITGRLEGDVHQAKLRLQMDGDVEGDKNLYVEYTVNYHKTKSPFPAWSPFLDSPGDINPTFVRQGLDLVSPAADFSEKGEHRNGVQVWYDYEYGWHAEKVGASPKDIAKQSDGELSHLAQYPYGGDWVGTGWGSETRFRRSRKQFVTQFSPEAAGTMTPEEGSEGVIMSLNVKHETAFYFHIDFDGNVSGRGTITYTLDPNLCGVAVLTRQVNERVNFMKYLPVIYTAAQQLGKLAVTRFSSAWTAEPGRITEQMDEFIRTLPPKIEPSVGAAEAKIFEARHPYMDVGNVAYAKVSVTGSPEEIWWRPSGEKQYLDPELNIAPALGRDDARVFDPYKWYARKGGGEWDLNYDSETLLMEHLAKYLALKYPGGVKGTITIYSGRNVCPFCRDVIEEAYLLFKDVTFVVTSGPRP